jgi:hypothetical protein
MDAGVDVRGYFFGSLLDNVKSGFVTISSRRDDLFHLLIGDFLEETCRVRRRVVIMPFDRSEAARRAAVRPLSTE